LHSSCCCCILGASTPVMKGAFPAPKAAVAEEEQHSVWNTATTQSVMFSHWITAAEEQ
jgi:hypothetical protein